MQEAAKYSRLNRHSQALHNSLPHFPLQYLTQPNKHQVRYLTLSNQGQDHAGTLKFTAKQLLGLITQLLYKLGNSY